MKKLLCLALSAICLVSVASCEFRESTKEPVDVPVISQKDEGTTAHTTEPIVTDVLATTAPPETTETETTTVILPDEPDAGIFAPIEELLKNPPKMERDESDVTTGTGEPDEPVEPKEPFIAFCYEDITTGISYIYNGKEIVYGASLMKMPFAVSILYKAEEEDVGLDDVFVFTGNENTDGTGEIKNQPIGKEYTHYELIEYLLKYSDNVALRELRRKFGNDVYFDYVRSLGADSFTGNWGWDLCAEDCLKVLRSAWEYIDGDYEYSEEIKGVMTKSMHAVMLSPGLGGKPIARKYGWDVDAYHDMGIVLDEHPYMLVFLSDLDTGGGEINGYINQIARTADAIHQEIWNNAESIWTETETAGE